MKINLLAVLAALSLGHHATAFVTTTTPHSPKTTSAQAWRRAASTLDSPPTARPPTPEDDEDDFDMSRSFGNNQPSSSSSSTSSFRDRLGNSGMASAAAMATAAVNAAVSMKKLEAPSVSKSYIALDRNLTTAVDEEGLPLVYDKDAIEAYWSKERGALQQRWRTFAGKAVPFLTKMLTLFIRDGSITEEEIPGLSRQARKDLQDLGGTLVFYFVLHCFWLGTICC